MKVVLCIYQPFVLSQSKTSVLWSDHTGLTVSLLLVGADLVKDLK